MRQAARKKSIKEILFKCNILVRNSLEKKTIMIQCNWIFSWSLMTTSLKHYKFNYSNFPEWPDLSRHVIFTKTSSFLGFGCLHSVGYSIHNFHLLGTNQYLFAAISNTCCVVSCAVIQLLIKETWDIYKNPKWWSWFKAKNTHVQRIFHNGFALMLVTCER